MKTGEHEFLFLEDIITKEHKLFFCSFVGGFIFCYYVFMSFLFFLVFLFICILKICKGVCGGRVVCLAR